MLISSHFPLFILLSIKKWIAKQLTLEATKIKTFTADAIMLIVAKSHHLDDFIEISLFPACYISPLNRPTLECTVCGDFGIRFFDLFSRLFSLLAFYLGLVIFFLIFKFFLLIYLLTL